MSQTSPDLSSPLSPSLHSQHGAWHPVGVQWRSVHLPLGCLIHCDCRKLSRMFSFLTAPSPAWTGFSSQTRCHFIETLRAQGARWPQGLSVGGPAGRKDSPTRLRSARLASGQPSPSRLIPPGPWRPALSPSDEILQMIPLLFR